MEPKSLSPTSLQVWSLCPARWAAEKLAKAETMSGAAASLGTTVHQALQWFVEQGWMPNEAAGDTSLAMLLSLYDDAWRTIMRTPLDGDAYDDGRSMLTNWHKRGVDVLEDEHRTIHALETKKSFPVKTTAGEITFNYVFDRLDVLSDGSVEVVDYKSNRARMGAAYLNDRIQARCYAVAAQIMFPDAPKVWVTFDLLRYDPVGTVFTRDQNMATWKYIRQAAQEIVDMPLEDAQATETINNDCRWCPIKHNCTALASNVEVGGILALNDPLEAAAARARANSQMNALKGAIEEIDAFLINAAVEADVTGWDNDDYTVNISHKGSRIVERPDALRVILGPELTAQYGAIGVTVIDKIKKDHPELADDLDAFVGFKPAATPSVSVVRKNAID